MYTTPFLDIPPLAGISGRALLPGSKSISNRLLLLAALAPGKTSISNLLHSDDTRVMLDALRMLGAPVQESSDLLTLGQLPPPEEGVPVDLFLGNAGTAMRPLTAALALRGGHYILHGTARMHERPIGDLVDALRGLGCAIEYTGQEGYPPLRIAPRIHQDTPASLHVRGDVSSQFLTALLMALPALTEDSAHPVTIHVDGPLISKPYIAITLSLLQRFGVTVEREDWSRFTVPAGSRLTSPREITVEPDASSASYLIAAATVSRQSGTGATLTIPSLDADSIQGDIHFIDAARAMGARISSTHGALEVRAASLPLHAIDLDCNAIPDAAMTVAMLALYADGPSTLRNIASWRVKETDRLSAMTAELRKIGATVEEGADFLRITPPANTTAWQAADWATYDDHRMAMCGALAAFNPAGHPVRIQDPACVGKTFPQFFETLFALAAPRSAIPVICVDGPSASGKGTLASGIAAALGYHYLDSGALYRLTGLLARRRGLLDAEPLDGDAIAGVARTLPVRFVGDQIHLEGEDVSVLLRTESTGLDASIISAIPTVRAALLAFQRNAARIPGLVTDGRDMGTVIFPQAALKIFLTASVDVRARRRYEQLRTRGIDAKIDELHARLAQRDARDKTRTTAPLQAAEDAILLDNSALTIEQSVQRVLGWWQERQPFGKAP